ncbi:MAG: Na/Pi cotransporter family protein, partial [Lachnospiraceae bacterium]|nr:Na/Pi cotransporter family protein [Lachnospiraceae bacterium]
LCDEMKMHHVERVQEGTCTILQGFIFNDILTNLERVSDHCSNIAVAMINLSQGNFETHEYLDHLKEKETEAFRKEVNAYAEKYKI